MKKPEGEPLLSVRPRETEVVSLAIPKDTLASLRQVAAQREISDQALLKFYIGQGLRQDLARLFGDRVLATTARGLARHLQSDEAQYQEKWASLAYRIAMNYFIYDLTH